MPRHRNCRKVEPKNAFCAAPELATMRSVTSDAVHALSQIVPQGLTSVVRESAWHWAVDIPAPVLLSKPNQLLVNALFCGEY
jgi:hypothetical protein